MLKPLETPEKIVQLIAQTANVDTAQVYRRLLAECGEIGSNVYQMMTSQKIPLYVPSRELDNFYRDADGFLYETTVWNTCAAKHRMRQFISSRLNQLNRNQADIFCFGDGLGFDSAYLAAQGHQVCYFEPSLRCQQFAQSVFKENGVTVAALDSLEDIAPHSLDVLEHVPDPQSMVRLFRSWLKPNGLLFVHAPFWFIHWTRPTHLKQNKTLSGSLRRMYSNCGFRAVDASIFWDPILLTPQENTTDAAPTASGRLRILGGRTLLSLGRGYSGIHMQIARRIARPPAAWVSKLQAAADAHSSGRNSQN